MPTETVIQKGDWVDLRASEDCTLQAPQAQTLKRKKIGNEELSYRDVRFSYALIPLGVAMQLPKGYEAVMVPRSSTYKKLGIIQGNNVGIIDETYCGDKDEWRFPAIALRNTTIEKGYRICQFRIQLSQKATIWQKIKWLFSSGIKIVEVPSLNNNNRGGIGSTGIE